MALHRRLIRTARSLALGVAAIPMTMTLVTVPATSANANEGSGATVFVSNVHGFTLEGFDSEVSDDGCLFTGTQIWTGTGEDGSPSAEYLQTFFNACTFRAGGVFGRATPTTLHVAGNLSSGQLVATIPLRDIDTLEPVGRSVFVDNTWTATSPATDNLINDVIMLPGDFRYVDRIKGRFTPDDATVTGTIPMDWGRLSWLTAHHVEVNMPPGF
jgi:hypothetical protein